MSSRLLTLNLPAIRALASLSLGKQTQREMITAGVASASVAHAVAELCAADLACVTRSGAAATAGRSAVTGLYALKTDILPPSLCLQLLLSTRTQARVLLALHVHEQAFCGKVVAQRAGVSYDAGRDAIAQCRSKGWIDADRYVLTEHHGNRDSTMKNTIAQSFRAPQKSVPHPISSRSDSESVKTEFNTVSKEKEKQQTTVVVNFSIFQKLLENGIPNDVAAQLIARDENECEIQIGRLEKLTNINNRPGFLRAAIANKYRDSIIESKNKASDSTIISKSDIVAQAQDYRPEHEKLARSVGVPTISESEKAGNKHAMQTLAQALKNYSNMSNKY
jgi:hypothetical protein